MWFPFKLASCNGTCLPVNTFCFSFHFVGNCIFDAQLGRTWLFLEVLFTELLCHLGILSLFRKVTWNIRAEWRSPHPASCYNLSCSRRNTQRGCESSCFSFCYASRLIFFYCVKYSSGQLTWCVYMRVWVRAHVCLCALATSEWVFYGWVRLSWDSAHSAGLGFDLCALCGLCKLFH